MRRNYYICDHVSHAFKSIIRDILSQFAVLGQESAEAADATIIICQPSRFLLYSLLQVSDNEVSIVTPLWAFYSSIKKVLQPLEFYSADPKMIFSGLCINIYHLDDCSMTDFYSNVILIFGGRICDHLTDDTTHTVMETKPLDMKQSFLHTEISVSKLESLKLNLRTLSIFVNYFYQIEEVSENNAFVVIKDEREYFLSTNSEVRTVSYSWLDSCISQRKKLPETDFYTVSKKYDQQNQEFKIRRRAVDPIDEEYDCRRNKSLPLHSTYLIVSNRISTLKRKVK